MQRTKAIREGVVDLNFPKVEHELKKQHPSPELPSELLTIVEQTGCLLIRRPDRTLEEKRNQFIASLREWLSHVREGDARDRFDRHCLQVELCQQGFREIYSSLEACPIGRLSAAISAWAAIFATATDMAKLWKAVTASPPPLIAPDLVFLTNESLRVSALGKSDLDPDSVAEHYATNLGGYIKMLGHLHGWFEDGSMRIPAMEPVATDLLQDRSALYLAEAWNQLEDHWERIRYFEGSSVHSEHSTPAPGREVTTLVFEHDWQYFLDIEVARARLRRRVFEISVHVTSSSKIAERVQDPTEHYVKVFPAGLISIHEAASMLALDMCYGLPIATDHKEYLGLTLSEWMRGYALLQFCCERQICLKPITDGLCYLDLAAFLNLASRAGMVRERTLLFIKQVTFQKNSRDLFDTPLIRTADDQYIVLSRLAAILAIHEAITSRINSLLLQVENKGRLFEEEVRESFEKVGATARRIEYRNAEGKFECDAAVLWGKDLFLVECKAYTLPQASASDLFFFRLKQEEAKEQVRRIARHITLDPSIIGKSFGHDLESLRTTMCVLNLAPFTLPGANQDVKLYDHGALSKFSEGAVKAILHRPAEKEGDPREQRIIARMWADEVPQSEDLLRQMDQPFQYLNEAKMWRVQEVYVQLSANVVMLSPCLGRLPDEVSDVPGMAQEIQAAFQPPDVTPLD